MSSAGGPLETPESEAPYRAFFELARDAMLLTDDSGRYVDANPAACALLGYSRQELQMLTVWDVTAPETADRFRPLWQELTSGGHASGECDLVRKDGTRVSVEFNSVANILPGLHFTIGRDLTERRRAAELLRASEQKYQSIIANAPLVLYMIDRTGHFTLSEGRGLEAVERRSDIVGQSAWELYGHLEVHEPSGRVSTGREVLERVLRGESVNGVLELNGRCLENTFIPLRTSDGAIDGVMGVAFDVTDLQRSVDALRSSQKLLRSVVTSAPVIVFALNRDGVFTLSEGRGLEALGLRPGQVVGTSALDLYSNVPDVTAHLQRALKGEMFIGPADVAGRSYQTWYSPIIDPGGAMSGVVGVATDITERTQLEEQLRQSQKLESVGRLAGGIAHDFNNMLTAINGYAELIMGRLPETDPMREEVADIKRAAEKASLLTYQLLAFSRKQILRPKTLNLNDVVSDVSKMLQRLIGEDIAIVARLEADLDPVNADPGQVAQVLMNLSVNARDAMPDGGVLTLETANVDLDADYAAAHLGVQPGRYVMLAVSDTGIGMSPDIKRRIFEPFFTTKPVGKGTGMGLATVHGIVNQSGGSLWVYSEEGHGSTFKVYLPRALEPAARTENAAPGAALARGMETILLVEDEDMVRRLVRRTLEGCGYRILEATDGVAALDICGDGTPIALLITDVVMPRMSGRELAGRLSASRPGLRVLFMSGYTDTAVTQHGMLDDATDFLQKPFTIQTLAEKVREVLDR